MTADLKIIDDVQKWFDFLKDRNAASHLYDEVEAAKIFDHIPVFVAEVKKLTVKMDQVGKVR